jgi:hypothetical protein
VKAVKPSTRNPSSQTEPFLSSFDYSSIEQSLTFHGISPQLCKLFFLTSSYRNPIQSTIASSKPQVQLIATSSRPFLSSTSESFEQSSICTSAVRFTRAKASASFCLLGHLVKTP